jgi:hypothetical protein
MPEMAQTVIGQASLADLAVGDLAFQERFQLRQRTIELVGNTHDGAGFLNARDRSVENVDPGHVLKDATGLLCSLLPDSCILGTGTSDSTLHLIVLEARSDGSEKMEADPGRHRRHSWNAHFPARVEHRRTRDRHEAHERSSRTTFHAANKAGATVTPSENPSTVEQ